MFRFATVVQRCGLVLAILLAVAPISSAQQAPLVGIEPIRGSLDQIEAATRRGGLGARALADLSQRIPPLREELRDKAAELEPRLAELDARLKGLGPAPAKDAPEDATIAAERTRLTQQRAEIDAAIKQVQLLQTRAEQLSNLLSERRRSAYAETLFRRSPNVLDPYFWRDVIAAAPDYAGRIVQFGLDWLAYARDKSDPERRLAARLAAKRAAAALLGAGMGEGEVEVLRSPGQPPRLRLSPRAEERLRVLGAERTLVSLTHGREQAAAAVLFVRGRA